MKLGIIMYSNDAETVWNAFRFGNFSLNKGDEVKLFLLGKGVEYESHDSADFRIKEQATLFLEGNGNILACGTCLEKRGSKGSETCPMSTMNDLYTLVKESDKIISF